MPSRFFSNRNSAVEPYTPGEQPRDQGYIKLNTNENPYPPSPRVIEALGEDAIRALNLYSDPQSRPLAEAVAKYHRLTPEQVFFGNGSDEVLVFAMLAFADDSRSLVFPDITYSYYASVARSMQLPFREIPLQDDLSVNVDDYIGCGGNVLLANPGAPTGIALSRADIARIAAGNPDHVVLIDEAYVDFGGESAIPLLAEHPNLLVVWTLSKSRSLAGARIGLAVGSEELISDMHMLRTTYAPYNVNRAACIAGAKSYEDEAYFRNCILKIIRTREYTKHALRGLGFTVTDSQANFVFASHPRIGGRELYEALKARGVLVRHFQKPRIEQFVRISIGTEAQMETVVRHMAELLG